MSRASRSRWRRTSGSRAAARSTTASGRSATSSRTTCSRSSRTSRWSRPARRDSESIRDEKVKVLKAIAPLGAGSLVRGQFRGFRSETGVAPDSTHRNLCGAAPRHRFAALAGGSVLPPRRQEPAGDLHRDHGPLPARAQLLCGPGDRRPITCALRISPSVQFAMGMLVLTDDDSMTGSLKELVGNADRRSAARRKPTSGC